MSFFLLSRRLLSTRAALTFLPLRPPPLPLAGPPADWSTPRGWLEGWLLVLERHLIEPQVHRVGNPHRVLQSLSRARHFPHANQMEQRVHTGTQTAGWPDPRWHAFSPHRAPAGCWAGSPAGEGRGAERKSFWGKDRASSKPGRFHRARGYQALAGWASRLLFPGGLCQWRARGRGEEASEEGQGVGLQGRVL